MDDYVKMNPVIKNLRLYNAHNNGKGYWSVAVRRQLDSLVFNGYMGAGDSMAMPNPISAGGIGPALVAGILAGENAAKAVQTAIQRRRDSGGTTSLQRPLRQEDRRA